MACTLSCAAHRAFADDNSNELNEVVVTANRLDAARNGLSTSTGSSMYNLDVDDIKALPLGDATPVSQVILQAPGVVQDSLGQLHVRGDHGNLQYRINGVAIPEAITGFGQSLDTRSASSISVMTGALPAQYGYHTAGVIDIHTKGYVPGSTGNVALTLGSHNDRELGGDYSNAAGNLSYSLIGSGLQNDLGIENPTANRNAIHDHNDQLKGFGYLSYILDANSRISLMAGASQNRFEIPNTPELSCAASHCYPLAGTDIAMLDSSSLNARQNENNIFDALTYQRKTQDNVDYQISLFHRRTSVHYFPDPVGDLVFNGIASTIQRQDEEVGLQADARYSLNLRHTLRSGIYLNSEHFATYNQSSVFPADDNGNQTTDVPVNITDNSRINGHVAGLYLQDEWQPSKSLTVNYGLRYDMIHTVVDEHQLSPRLGLIYDLTDRTHLHTGYARYFTPPPTEKIDTTSIAKFANTTNALPSGANTAIKSERSHYFDVGITQEIGNHLLFGLDTYYRSVANLQDEGQFGNALIFSAFNYEEGRVYGAEFTASYAIDKLSIYANMAYSVAQARGIESGQFNFDSNEIAYIANHWVNLDHDQRLAGSAGVSYAYNRLHLSADMLYGSGLRRGFANTEKLPSYAQYNVAVSHDFNARTLGAMTIKIAVLNLTDTTYQLRDGSGIGVGASQYGTRRAFYVSLSKSY